METYRQEKSIDKYTTARHLSLDNWPTSLFVHPKLSVNSALETAWTFFNSNLAINFRNWIGITLTWNKSTFTQTHTEISRNFNHRRDSWINYNSHHILFITDVTTWNRKNTCWFTLSLDLMYTLMTYKLMPEDY